MELLMQITKVLERPMIVLNTIQFLHWNPLTNGTFLFSQTL